VKSSIRIVWNTLKVFIAFTGCTLLFYYGMIWLNQEYENYHRYDEPSGRAVKVFIEFEEDRETNWLNRLWLFYDIGE
jgi:hypothetical protein